MLLYPSPSLLFFFFWELEEFEKKKNSLQVECMLKRMSLEFVYYLIDFAVVIYNTTLLFCPPDPLKL